VLAPRPPWQRRAIVGVVVLVVVVLAFLKLRPTSDDGIHVVRAAPVAFNFRYPPGMKRLAPVGHEWAHVERRAGGKLVDSFSVQPLHLAPYTGDISGVLPVIASHEVDLLKQQYPGFELVDEGKARINQVPGYTLAFRTGRNPRGYGRVSFLPEPTPGALQGVKLVMLVGNPKAGGVGNADDVGTQGLLKTPYRTFRFGTQAP
jgi:hypothetical protein